MPNDMEQIEARLAAYIDGVLPPEQRAEIEKYLAANPGHAALISELKSIKTAVAGLPREKAPAEVLDTLQSHLERQTLLAGVEETATASRINRWPQFGAVAAMLLLTAGLGLLVYQVLPRGQSGAAELALLPPATKPMVSDADLDTGVVALEPPATRKDEATATAAESLPIAAQRASPSPSLTNENAGASASPPPTGAASTLTKTQPPPAGVAPMASPPTTEASERMADRFTINGPDTRPAYTDFPVEHVVITTADPRLSRNLVAGTLATMDRPAEAGPPSTRPSMGPTTGPAGAAAGEVAVPNGIVLLVHGVSDADVARLRDTAGDVAAAAKTPTTQAAATGLTTPATTQTSPIPGPATAPVRDMWLVFRTAATTKPATVPAPQASP